MKITLILDLYKLELPTEEDFPQNFGQQTFLSVTKLQDSINLGQAVTVHKQGCQTKFGLKENLRR